MRRLLDSPSASHQAGAIGVAFEYADAVAQVAWEQAEDQPPRKRVSVALHAAAEMLQGLGLALATDDMPATE